jgi:F-type H+-transporting ATPase subunit epsilon
MANLKISIISHQGILFEGECDMAVVPSALGEIGLMSGHESYVANLIEGEVKLYDNSNNITQTFAISGGFVEMANDNKLTILVN